MSWTPVSLTTPIVGLRVFASRATSKIVDIVSLKASDDYYGAATQWYKDNGVRLDMSAYTHWQYVYPPPVPTFRGVWIDVAEIPPPLSRAVYVDRTNYAQIASYTERVVPDPDYGTRSCRQFVDDYNLPYLPYQFQYFAYLPDPP